MPEKEFEIYLSLLSKLLRLSPAQKAAISDELRDHMEERLETLMKSGVSREEAIKTAMDEFGDVTGLALDLTRVSRTPLRKIVIGGTLTASAAAALIVGWVTFFAPQHRAIAPTLVQAQQAQQPTESVDNVAKPAKQPSPAVVVADKELFPAFLMNPTEVDLADVPLNEACRYLADKHEVWIFSQRQKFTDEGINPDTPVNLKLAVSFEEVLNHITRPLTLAWYVDEGVVQITTKTAEQGHFLTRNWDLRRLTKLGHTIPSLESAIRLAGDKWTDVDGDGGSISLFGETVVVRQTYHVQRRIAQLLAAIERKQPMTMLEICTDRDRLHAALKEPCAVEFSDTPLSQAIAYISDQHKIAIQIDQTGLNDEGLNSDVPITITLNKPLKKLFDLMLGELALTYVIRDGAFRITTQNKADEEMAWGVYNISDIANSKELVDQFVNAITHSTSGQWYEVDGQGGEIVPMEAGGCLVIKQTDRVHFEIQALIAQLRQSPLDPRDEAHKPAKGSAMITKTYRMPKDVASDLLGAIPNLVARATWNPTEGERPTIELIASTPIMDEVDGLASGGNLEIHVINVPAVEKPVTQSAPPANAGNPPAAPMSAPPKATPATPSAPSVKSIVARPSSVLVIRHTPEVHREIQTLLKSLNVRVEPGTLGNGGGFMGGMGGGGMGGGGMGGGGFF